jgi:hypothetical protein
VYLPIPLLRIGSCEELNFEHFDMEGDSNKGVKRAINNNTTVKIN